MNGNQQRVNENMGKRR